MREAYKQAFDQKHPDYAKAIDRADHAARMR